MKLDQVFIFGPRNIITKMSRVRRIINEVTGGPGWKNNSVKMAHEGNKI